MVETGLQTDFERTAAELEAFEPAAFDVDFDWPASCQDKNYPSRNTTLEFTH